MNRPVSATRAALGAILAAALLLRLYQIGFGLPGLYDPDEPLFMVKAAGLLTARTLNPHWFGHPGSTTIYLTALIQALVFLTGWISGRFASVADFVHAAYSDPAIVFVPVRIAMALIGTACVGLSYALGRRLYGSSVGLLAALLLALNSLHIAWSQVVRTDVQASAFMLGALLVACRLGETGSRKHAIWAGLLTGFAVATKWPAVSVFAGVIGAAIYQATSTDGGWRGAARLILIAGLASVIGLFIASPFIFIDYPTVLSNLAGEARPVHVGHTGGGAASNLATYLALFAKDSMGWIGLTLAGAGFVIACVRRGPARYILVPATIVFFVSICVQHLIWSRWLIPGLPYLALFAAAAVFELAALVSRGAMRRGVIAAAGGLAVLASAAGAVGEVRERANDTRDEAVRWVVAHAANGSTIIIEYPELKLHAQPFRFLFPVGSRGCQDARSLLTSNIRYEDVQQARGGSPVVDLGNIPASVRASCHADYAVLTYYDLYLKEADRFPEEIATYRQILAGGRTVALWPFHHSQVGTTSCPARAGSLQLPKLEPVARSGCRSGAPTRRRSVAHLKEVYSCKQ